MATLISRCRVSSSFLKMEDRVIEAIEIIDSDDEDTLPNSSITKTDSCASSPDTVFSAEFASFALRSDSPSPEVKKHNIFETIPAELNCMIAAYLPKDIDISNYARTSGFSSEIVRANEHRIFAMRFRVNFDSENLDDKAATEKYKLRKIVGANWTAFIPLSGHRNAAHVNATQQWTRQRCLTVVKDLLMTANGQEFIDEDGVPSIHSKNFDFIKSLITGSNGMSYLDIVDGLFCTAYDSGDLLKSYGMPKKSPRSQLLAIQLCLTPLILHPDHCKHRAFHDEISQFHVYACPSKLRLFWLQDKSSVKLIYFLHVVNFFKHHLKSDNAGILAHQYSSLEKDQYPSLWCGTLESGRQALGSHWICASTWLPDRDLLECRVWEDFGMIDDHGDLFQNISMSFDEELFSTPQWRNFWNRWNLHFSLYDTRCAKDKSKALLPTTSFMGVSQGSRTAYIFGQTHPVDAHGGISGFQRITMLHYLSYNDVTKAPDMFKVYAYEGLVLPGSRVIVGRWWDTEPMMPDGTHSSGPFLLYSVPNDIASEPVASDVHDIFEAAEAFQLP